MSKIVKVTDPVVIGLESPQQASADRHAQWSADPRRTDEELAQHDVGFRAGTEGKPNDDKKSEAWQRGWADAQE